MKSGPFPALCLQRFLHVIVVLALLFSPLQSAAAYSPSPAPSAPAESGMVGSSASSFNRAQGTATEIDVGILLVDDNDGDDRGNGAGVSYMAPPLQQVQLTNGASTSTGPGPFDPEGLSGAEGAGLSLIPSNSSVQVGDIFTMDVVADTGAGAADTVDAYLDFDPIYLEVVDESGAPATSIEANIDLFDFVTFNAADNTTGQINFSATRLDASLTGNFTAATIRFRAKAAVDATDVIFVRSGARISELYQSGEPLNAALTNATVTITSACPDFVDPPGVDIGDVQFVATKWRQDATGQLYDCDGDGAVTVVDILCVAKRLGNPCPTAAGATTSAPMPAMATRGP